MGAARTSGPPGPRLPRDALTASRPARSLARKGYEPPQVERGEGGRGKDMQEQGREKRFMTNPGTRETPSLFQTSYPLDVPAALENGDSFADHSPQGQRGLTRSESDVTPLDLPIAFESGDRFADRSPPRTARSHLI